MQSTFRKELESLLNKHSMENESNTPDFILADYLCDCLDAFDKAINKRKAWYSENNDEISEMISTIK